MWFKKKAYISGFNANTDVDGTDMRTNFNMKTGSYVSNILPSAADANKYFYLPALGLYTDGRLKYVGDNGRYWSSSADPRGRWGGAYYLSFGSSYVFVLDASRDTGFRVDGFE